MFVLCTVEMFTFSKRIRNLLWHCQDFFQYLCELSKKIFSIFAIGNLLTKFSKTPL